MGSIIQMVGLFLLLSDLKDAIPPKVDRLHHYHFGIAILLLGIK